MSPSHTSMLSILRQEGFPALYKGIVPTLYKDIFFQMWQYCFYQQLNHFMGDYSHNKTATGMLYGGISSFAAYMLVYPFDFLRSKLQLDTTVINKHTLSVLPRNTLSIASQIYLQAGFKGFYRGYQMRLIKKIITNAVGWGLYENIKVNSTE